MCKVKTVALYASFLFKTDVALTLLPPHILGSYLGRIEAVSLYAMLMWYFSKAESGGSDYSLYGKQLTNRLKYHFLTERSSELVCAGAIFSAK